MALSSQRPQRVIAGLRMLGGFACLVLALLLFLCHYRWLVGSLGPPSSVDPADLAEIATPDRLANPWVTIDLAKSVEAGVGLAEKPGFRRGARGRIQWDNGRWISRFLLVPAGDAHLAVEVPPDWFGREVTGHLEAWPVNRPAGFEGKRLLPFVMVSEAHSFQTRYALLGCIFLIGLAGLYLLVTGIRASMAATGTAVRG